MSPKSKKLLDMLDELFQELPPSQSQASSASSSSGLSHGKMLQALFQEELPSGLSQEHAASAGATGSQPTAVAATVAAAAAPNPKLLHEVKVLFKYWVLPKLNPMPEDAPILINGFLNQWAPRRYNNHSKWMKQT